MAMDRVASLEEKGRLPVLIVDDDAPVRQGIWSMLEGHADLQIIGEASDGFKAVHLVHNFVLVSSSWISTCQR